MPRPGMHECDFWPSCRSQASSCVAPWRAWKAKTAVLVPGGWLYVYSSYKHRSSWRAG
jgi:hypothetical protein